MGFEPTNPYGIGASGAPRPFALPSSIRGTAAIDYEQFKTWLYANYRPLGAYPVYHYALKYGSLLQSRDLSVITGFTDGKRASTIKALCVLSKFLGMHEEFKALVKGYGLKWRGKSADDVIIDRLTKNTDSKAILQWIRDARKISELQQLTELLVSTGIRLCEGVDAINLIIKLSSAWFQKHLNKVQPDEADLKKWFDSTPRRLPLITVVEKDAHGNIQIEEMCVDCLYRKLEKFGAFSGECESWVSFFEQ